MCENSREDVVGVVVADHLQNETRDWIKDYQQREDLAFPFPQAMEPGQ